MSRPASAPTRQAASDRELTDVDSTSPLEDPAWQPSLLDKLRVYRYATVPGWMDRVAGPALKEGSIRSVRDPIEQAHLRRRIAFGIALHMVSVTALVALGIYIPALAQRLHEILSTSWKRGVLAASLPLQIVLLKLVLDMPGLRTVSFGFYAVSVAALVAVIQFEWPSPHDVLACNACLTSATIVNAGLFGASYNGKFPGFPILWTALTVCAGSSVGVASTISSVFAQDGTSLLATTVLIVVTWCLVYEMQAFLRELTPAEASLAVFLLPVDIMAAAIRFFVYAVMFTTIAVTILAGVVAQPVAWLLRCVVPVAWFSRLESACGCGCVVLGISRSARVAVDNAQEDRNFEVAMATIIMAMQTAEMAREGLPQHVPNRDADPAEFAAAFVAVIRAAQVHAHELAQVHADELHQSQHLPRH